MINKEKNIKVKVDFYADGFRSEVVEFPESFKVLSEPQKEILLAEQLIKLLPYRSEGWRMGGSPKECNTITFIIAKIQNEKTCNKLLAPIGMTILLKRGKENETADRLNVQRFTDNEKELMEKGTMAYRHIEYETYWQKVPFSYE